MTPGRTPAGGRRVAFVAFLGFLLVAFVALGAWQVERRSWKLGLIAATDTRVHAPVVAAPGPDAWPGLSAAADEYRHVAVDGAWVPGRDTAVRALTERGPWVWAVTPLRTGAGWTVLVNRGFVPSGTAVPAAGGAAHVTGLLRWSEASGWLFGNDPAADRWATRDVPAIAAARGLGDVAPYFIDAAAGTDPGAVPVGGLTVVTFRNAHLAYALTWFALALVSLVGLVLVLRPRRG